MTIEETKDQISQATLAILQASGLDIADGTTAVMESTLEILDAVAWLHKMDDREGFVKDILRRTIDCIG
jgi:hypothetical protein